MTSKSARPEIKMEHVPTLYSKMQWFQWNEDIIRALTEIGYGDLLSKQQEDGSITQPSEPTDEENEMWRKRQIMACAEVSDKVAIYHQSPLSACEKVQEMLDLVEKTFKPRPSVAAFCAAWDKLSSLPVGGSIESLAAHLNDARKQYLRLGEELPSSITIPAFLSALGPEFLSFRMNYFHGKTILKSSDPNLRTVTIDDVILAAEEFEANIVVLQLKKTTNTSLAQPNLPSSVLKVISIQGDRATVQVQRCNHCEKLFHNAESCHVKHPHLKPKKGKKRQRSDSNASTIYAGMAVPTLGSCSAEC